MKSANSVMSFRSRLKCFLLNMSGFFLSLYRLVDDLDSNRIFDVGIGPIAFAGHANELGDLLILAK